ncbi:MAG: hypothetical protein ACF8R7_16720 [Phycisphaerales bacterium JB039]
MSEGNRDFTDFVLSEFRPVEPFTPAAYYDRDGDCIEFLASAEPYRRTRLDKWVTVYHGRESGDIVGSCIKSVSELMKEWPGLDIEVEGGQVWLSHFFRATAWSEGDPVKKARYRAVIAKLDELRITAELEPA